jgi:hypothetical protein
VTDDVGGTDEHGSAEEPGYVHRPSGEPAAPDTDRRFDWRGWVLVAAIAVSFVVVPAIILLWPTYATATGLSLRDAYLVLPLIPAFLLGAVAVWSAVRSRGL